MEVFILILMPIIVLFVWMLFVPVYIRIDTQRNLYELKQTGTVHLTFTPGGKPSIEVRVFGMAVPKLKRPKKKADKEKRKIRFIKRSLRKWLFLLRDILKCFKIKRLEGTVDLDDVVLHSQFCAISPFINRGPVYLTTNLSNSYYLDLTIEGRLNKILYTLILFLTRK